MIIGNGDIAKTLKVIDRDDIVFFASGVSNSQETRESEYKRELDLLLEQDKTRHIVYFSSLCIFYSNTRYSEHKKQAEACLRAYFERYTIVRIGNITWGDNPHTLINYFKNRIKNNENLVIKDEYRYLIDQHQFIHWVKMIPSWNCEMNITGDMVKVQHIAEKYGYKK